MATKDSRLEARGGAWRDDPKLAYHEALARYCGVELPEWVRLEQSEFDSSPDAYKREMERRRKFFTGSEDIHGGD